MNSMPILDGSGNLVYVMAVGDGTQADPYRYAPMDYVDALVDSGLVFQHSERQELANNAKLDHLIVTPLGVHTELLLISISPDSGPINIDLYEGAIVSANGTAHTLYNLNRKSVNTTSTTLYENPTVTDVGQHLLSQQASGSKDVGNSSDREGRIVLKESEKYLLRIVNESGTNAFITINIRIGED